MVNNWSGAMTDKNPKVFLNGRFRIAASSGEPVEIRSAKARALIALLACSEDGWRERHWIQSILWSDRASEQAAGSLRQTLRQLRVTLKNTGIALISDRASVSLDLDALEIAEEESQEFLEGMHIPDPAFIAWLSQERRRRRGSTSVFGEQENPIRTSDWNIVLSNSSVDQGSNRWFENLLSDALSRSLREYFSAPVSVDSEAITNDGTIRVQTECFSIAQDAISVRVAIDHPGANHQIWSGNRSIPLSGAPPIDHPDMLQLVNEMVEALGDYLILVGDNNSLFTDPDKICRMAIRSLFAMTPEKVAEADASFERAFEMQQRGLYLAWRAQLRAIQSIERHNVDAKTLEEEGRYFCERALELEPSNSMVLATLANALRRFERNDQRSLHMAKQSVQINPANPMGWWALSAALLYVGEDAASLKAGVIARRLAILSPNRFWWDNQRFAPYLLNGNLQKATEFAELSHAGNPNFRPPLRHLIALYANDGRDEEALEAARKLANLESDFAIERLVRDASYPASLLGKTPNLDTDRLLSLK